MSDIAETYDRSQARIGDAMDDAFDAIDYLLRTAQGETSAWAVTPAAEAAAVAAERLADLVRQFVPQAIHADASRRP